MKASMESQPWGKMPASCCMAGATPMTVDGKFSGGDPLAGEPVRKGYGSEFVYDSRVPLSQTLGCQTPSAGKALPSGQALLKPMNFN